VKGLKSRRASIKDVEKCKGPSGLPNKSLRLCVDLNLQTLQLNGDLNPQPGKFNLRYL